MNLKWSKTELGEIVDTLKGCAFKSKDYVFDGVPVVRVSDFTENSIAEDKLVYLPEALAVEYSAYKLQHNNIVIQTVGSWQYNPASVVGKVIKIPKKLSSSLLNQNAVKLIPNQNIDEKFLYYRLKDDTFKAHVLGSAQGAANQASITLTTIKRFKFFLPPLEIQQKIAVILSAYDDLIENNLKRIKLLEEMAQITYEEWFVRLKFPGHETAPIDSETGLPEGWCFGKVLDLFELQRGFDLPIQERENGAIPIIASTGVTGFHSSCKVNGPGVVTGRSGTIGRVMFIHSDFWPLNTTLWVKKYQSCGPIFAKHFLQNFNLESLCGGSAVPSLDRKAVHVQRIVIPTAKLMKNFEIYASSLYEATKVLRFQNDLLKEARDILLPRLMTGMIDVEQLVLPEPFSNTPSSPEKEPQAA